MQRRFVHRYAAGSSEPIESANLSHWWHFDTTGQLTDLVGSSNPSLNGSVTTATNGPGGKDAIDYGGPGNYHQIGSRAPLGNYYTGFSVAFWVWLDSMSTSGNFIFDHRSSGATNRYVSLKINNDRTAQFVIYDGTGTTFRLAMSSATIPLSTWSMVGGSHDGTTTKVYIDGVVDGENSDSLGAQTTGNKTFRIAQLASSGSANHHHNGRLATGGTANEVWTAGQWLWLYNSGNGRLFSEFE